jgi:two-component system cell cycle response regulator
MSAKALIVDDSELTRAVLRRYLHEAGFEVVEAADGAEGAVAALKERPSIVVTDLEMPVMDGYQLARLIKTDPSTSAIPVVIVTGHTEATSRFWGLEIGADAYITKCDLDRDLIGTVNRLAKPRPREIQEALPPPEGPLEVLARVARHLDTGLLEATLVNHVLQIGMARGSFSEAADAVLGLISRLTHADLLAICVLDGQGLRIHVHRPEDSRRGVDEEELKLFVVRRFATDLSEVAAVSIEGASEEEEERVEVDGCVSFDLALRGAVGFLAVWPTNPDEFVGLPRTLIEKASPHVALVLDNVRLAEHLWELSTHDGLTRVLNHRAIRQRLNNEVERAIRQSASLAVILCDIDRFKAVNDIRGHLVGDAVLREVAKRVAERVRSTDSVGRYGGEEFLAVLPHTTLDAARAVAQRICQDLIGNPIEVSQSDAPVPVSASFGVACNCEITGMGPAEVLLALADRRLYKAKAAGRACVKP